MRYAKLACLALCGMSLGLTHGKYAAGAQPSSDAAANCAPDGELRYVCGPVNAEDLVRLGSTRWLIGSGLDGPLTGGAPARGKLYLVDHEAKTAAEWFPTARPAFRHDQAMFGSCPGPLDPSSFSAHGLAVREQGPDRHRLYVTGHGAREAIEVFDIDTSGTRPAITWTGCVVLPEKVSANSVAILPDGGFITTQFMDRSLPLQQAFAQVTSGAINGRLYEWHPGGSVQAIPGTEMSGPNGIVTSSDGNTIYVAGYGSHDVVRFRRTAAGVTKDVVKLDVTPDNLHWSENGKILAAGAVHGTPGNCGTPPCAPPWSVLEIDPQSLAVRRLVGGDRLTGMLGVTVGIAVGREIWLGTYSGNRIGYVPAP